MIFYNFGQERKGFRCSGTLNEVEACHIISKNRRYCDQRATTRHSESARINFTGTVRVLTTLLVRKQLICEDLNRLLILLLEEDSCRLSVPRDITGGSRSWSGTDRGRTMRPGSPGLVVAIVRTVFSTRGLFYRAAAPRNQELFAEQFLIRIDFHADVIIKFHGDESLDLMEWWFYHRFSWVKMHFSRQK